MRCYAWAARTMRDARVEAARIEGVSVGKSTHCNAYVVMDVAGKGVQAARETKDRVHSIWKDDE